ncbi:MAG: thioredoxin family protein [Granulosicoccus sp.]
MAPAFELPDTRNGESVALSHYAGQPVIVAFICNHCPYVVHIMDAFAKAAVEFAEYKVATIAISANNAKTHPADAPEKMTALAHEKGFQFPYCYDESQAVAKAYHAVCTPDIYLFDAQHRLYYRGQFDDSRPGSGTASGLDLKNAVQALLAGHEPANDTKPSVGCSIKWKS